uniref:Uncharacterized protein n=1 Tax=Meloidogyne incognita TaxID=6306 RepID=A0A914KN18_MELIC
MKRADIQGLRTIAILAVIFLHIWPTYYPSGFLGVDIDEINYLSYNLTFENN